MKMSLYQHPRAVWLLFILIVVAGLNAFFNMPRLEDPHMQSRIVRVTTFYPGADAERVEAEVTEKLEQKIREIAEVKEVRSTSTSGVSVITIELEDRVNDAKPITARLRDKVAEVTDLPQGVTAPDFSDTQIYAHSGILALTWDSTSEINYPILGRHAAELESKLRNLSNTDFVDVIGLPNEEIRVEVDDAKLASFGLTISDVVGRIQASDARSSAGVMAGENDRLVISVDGQLDNLARIRRIPLAFDEAGASLRLGDVASVERTLESPVSNLAFIDGKYGVVIAARMFEDGRINDWSKQIDALMLETNKTLPNSIKLERIFDQRIYADERLNNLMTNLAVGALVVLIVLFISLGWRASAVSASILPLTLLAALAITAAFGLRIQQVLVTGLIVALGIMVDNAIVMTDEIQQLLLKGERRSVAVGKTIKKLWLPLLGSTLTTIIAFMPLILMPGGAGDFMLGVPAAVIASLIASYVIAFTIIAALAGRVVKGQLPVSSDASKPPQRIWWQDGVEGKTISRWFEKSLRWSTKRPLRSVAFAMAIPLMGFVLAGQLTEQFFPVSDRDQFQVQIFMPAQSSIEETRLATEKAHAYIKNIDEVQSAHWFIGATPAKFYYAMTSANDGVVSNSEAVVTVSHYEEIPDIILRLQDDLSVLIPEAMVLVREFGTGPPIQAPLEIRVLGPDLAVLEQVGEELRGIMATVPNITHTRMSIKPGRPQISVKAREDDASVTGLSLSAIEEQLRTLTAGVTATHVIEATEQVPVKVIAKRANRQDIDAIANMNLIAPNPALENDGSFADVPLSAVADVQLTTKVGSISRFNAERMNQIQGYLEFGTLPETGFAALQERLDASDIDLPAGYRIEFGGESETRNEALGKLFGTVGLLVVLMILTIVLTFNSFRMAMVTFAAAVQAAGLGLFSMWVFDYPLSFVVILGLMGLIGLSINAAIVILSELRGIPEARAGNMEAVIHGVMKTGRHIISTTLTTVGGFMPLILAGGAFWPPFAVAIAGGAFLAMIVSFYFAPAAFLWLTRIRPVSAPGGQKRLQDEEKSEVMILAAE